MAKTPARKPTTKQASKPKAEPRRQPENATAHEKPINRARPRGANARYDAAQTDAESKKHWASADSLSAAAANNHGVRRTLRNRARYEVANNCYARGIVNTVSNHVIGTGPRLHVETGNPDADEIIEREFCKQAHAVSLGSKLRTMQEAKRQDGEAFAVLKTNDKLLTRVKLDIFLVECDRVTTMFTSPEILPGKIDGIDYDDANNPTTYHILKQHPGDTLIYTMLESIPHPAAKVIHWFRCDRPGQLRGVPEIMPALPLFAYLRRMTLATVAATETLANFALVAQSNLAPDTDESAPDPFEELEISRNMMTVLPQGWSLSQVDPKQPVTGYREFKQELLNEIARCLDMPFNIAACNSSGYNYSSGRLDHQTYYRSIEIEQQDCERVVLSRFFAAWVEEASLEGVLPPKLPPMDEWVISWFWDGQDSVDAQKDALADTADLANGSITLAEIIGRRGGDWRKVMRQQAVEAQYRKQLETQYGVTLTPVASPNSPMNQPNPQPGGDYANQAA